MRRPLTITTALLLASALTACTKDDKTPTAMPSLHSEATPAAEASATPPGGGSSPQIGGGGGTPTTTKTSSGGGGTTTSTAPTNPIAYFKIKTDAKCQSTGPGGFYSPGSITLEWKVNGASHITISIDGPGIYGTYPGTHAEEFNFPCSGNSGSTQTHTYLLRTIGLTPVREATVKGSARVN